MSQHIAYMKKSVAMTLPALKREYIDTMVKRRTAVVRTRNSISGNLTPTSTGRRTSDVNLITTFVSDIREEDCIIRGERRKFRRIFVHCTDSGEYAKVGWILLDDMDFCMTCFKGIQGMFNYKNHCHACGNIICTSCSQCEDFIFEIEAVGPVAVCMFCDFGQDPIHAFPNNSQGKTIIDNFDEDLEKDEEALMYNVAKKDGVDEHQVNLWTFGKMTIEPIKGAFVFRTRRDKDYSIVYINVCSCDAVPCNAQHSLEGEIIIFMAISQLYKATNDADVYDIAVHPKIIMDINQDKSKEFRAKVCEQVLNAISLFTSELSFSTYTLDAKVPGPYLDHKKENFGNEKQPNLPYGFHSHLGIPAKDAFTTLYQIPTSLKEALTPQAINLGSNPKERDEIIRKTSNIRRDKIRAKLIGRSLSQLTTMDADNASSTIAQSSKTPETPLTPPPPAAPKFKSVADLFNQQEVIEENDPVNNKTAPNPIAIPNTQPFASKPVVSPKASSSVAKDLVKTRKIVSFVPHPGFVVKTRVTSGVELNLRISDASDTDDPIARKSDVDHGKVFVNICHHPKVDELMQKYGMRRQSLSEGIAPSSSAKPLFMVFGEKNSITDKHGSIATLITVAVGSSYFANSDEATAENPLLITSDEYISMIIGRINTHYRESFDSINFSLPRVKGGYKGDLPTDAKQFSYEAMVETKEEQSPARSSIISDIIHFPKTIADSIAGKNKNKNTPNKKLEVDDDGGIDDSISLRKSLGLADDNIADDISVMSDVTTESVARNMPANRRKTLRSSIFEKMGKLQQTDGQNMITPEMMVIIDDCGITITDSQNLKHYSCERPDVLLGWQIMLHNSHKKKDVYVITGMRKNNLSKTEYRLSSLEKADYWSTLKRASNKSGVQFQPLRKVLDITEQGVLN